MFSSFISLPGWRPAWRAYVLLLLLTFFFILFFFLVFNDRLEQTELRTYQTDLHEIFRVGRHVAVDVQSGICFAQSTLPWQPILGAISAEICDMPSFLGLAFHNGWQDDKADERMCLSSSKPLHQHIALMTLSRFFTVRETSRSLILTCGQLATFLT